MWVAAVSTVPLFALQSVLPWPNSHSNENGIGRRGIEVRNARRLILPSGQTVLAKCWEGMPWRD